MNDLLDQYLENEFQKAKRTKNLDVENFLIVNDPVVKRRWAGKLFDEGVKSPSDFLIINEFLQLITKNELCEFTRAEMGKMFEEKVIEEFWKKTQIVDVNKGRMEKFACNLVKGSWISKSGVINIWHTLALQTTEKSFIVPSLANFLGQCVVLVKNVNEAELIEKLVAVKDLLSPFLYFKDFSDHRSEIRFALKYLDKLLKNPKPEIALKLYEDYDEIDAGFKRAVWRILNKELTGNFAFNLNNPKKAAKFYMENALNNSDLQISKYFSWAFTAIVNDRYINEQVESFKSEVISICERNFIRQHSESTRSEYSSDEIYATNRFICELLVKRFIPTEKGESLMKFILNQKNESEISAGCYGCLFAAVLSKSLGSNESDRLVSLSLSFDL